jgi:hypothetical protein
VRHTADADEFLEISSNELRSVVADDPGRHPGILLESSLDNCFDVAFFHLRPDLLSPGASKPATYGRLSALQNQPPLSGCFGSQFNTALWKFGTG